MQSQLTDTHSRVCKKINLQAPINDLGYGVAGLNFLMGLAAEHEVSLFPIGREVIGRCDQRWTYDAAVERAKQYDDLAPSLRIYHQNDLAPHVGRGPRIGFPFFELDPLTPEEVYHANRMDRYLVASRWAKGVAERSGVTVPISVVPLGVDREIFRPQQTELEKTAFGQSTVFFNVGKWEVRKGHDVLLSAFNKAFSPTDDVILRMCCSNPFIGRGNAEWERHYMTSKMGAAGRIQIVGNRLGSQYDVATFMNQGDVGVFPARAEGWNLDLLEAMACGKHVIATDYSGHTEFVTDENARLIPVDNLEEARDGVWFHGQGEWAHLGEEQEDVLIAEMRRLHALKQTGRPMENRAALDAARRFSWANATNALIDALFT